MASGDEPQDETFAAVWSDPDQPEPRWSREREQATDERWIDSLLHRVFHADAAGAEARLSRLLTALEEPVEQPTLSLPEARTKISRRRWFVPSLSVAASLFVLVALWQFAGDSQRTAHAAVQQMLVEANSLVDRHYNVAATRKRGDVRTNVNSEFYLRGGQKYAIEHPGLAGNIWLGWDGQRSWIVSAFGTYTRNDPRLLKQIANREGTPLPDLQLTTVLERVSSHYDLHLLPSETLKTGGAPLERLHCILRGTDGWWPDSIDIWADSMSGVVERLRLNWDKVDSQSGLETLDMRLADQYPRSAKWYSPEGHQAAAGGEGQKTAPASPNAKPADAKAAPASDKPAPAPASR